MGINKRYITYRDKSSLEGRKRYRFCLSRFSYKEYDSNVTNKETLLIFIPKENNLMYSETTSH